MSFDNVQALPPGTRLGDYRLDAMIGHGGFGITYRAFDSQLAKVVAIKEYLPIEFAVRQADGQVVPRGARFADDFAWGRERFLDEARALARFRHPHIVPVLRYFEANGTAYTVMEFEDGQSVGELLRESGRRLPPDDVRRLADGLLSGLGAVHAQGFLHRDIKPSNIIIRRDGVPVLIDFGAARQAMGDRTRTLTGVLTPQYAPIEQYALDGKQGPWSDIYSAAAVLHHAIAGEPPPEAARRVGKDPYRPLAETQRDRFEPAFLAAIDRALAFAPAERPQTVEEWSTLFGVVAAVRPTMRRRSAWPTPPASRRRAWAASAARRRRSAVEPPPRPRIGSLLWIVRRRDGPLALWRFQPEIRGLLAGARTSTSGAIHGVGATAGAFRQSPAPAPATQPQANACAGAAGAESASARQGARRPGATRRRRRARGVRQGERSARTARTMAGEARIAAARAARPGLENAPSACHYDDGASYVGQVADGKRQGLGVARAKDGDQAGEWKDNVLNGLGTERLPDGRATKASGATACRPALACARSPASSAPRATSSPAASKGSACGACWPSRPSSRSGEFRADLLEGPGVETLGDGERYEGSFRAGKRHGYGQVTAPTEVTRRPLGGRKARRINALRRVAWKLRPAVHRPVVTKALSVLLIDDNPARAEIVEAGLRDGRLSPAGAAGRHAGSDRARARTGARRRGRQHRQPEPRRDRGHAPQHRAAAASDRAVRRSVRSRHHRGGHGGRRLGLCREGPGAGSRARRSSTSRSAHFNRYHAMREELERARLILLERKTVDRAKGLLMEQQAHGRGGRLQAAAQARHGPEQADRRGRPGDRHLCQGAEEVAACLIHHAARCEHQLGVSCPMSERDMNSHCLSTMSPAIAWHDLCCTAAERPMAGALLI